VKAIVSSGADVYARHAASGGKMRRSTRKFTGASAMIAIAPVYALVELALA